jgi:rhomboid protease GluP
MISPERAMFDENSRAEPIGFEPPVQQRVVARPASVVTIALIVINVLIYLAMVLNGISATNPAPEAMVRWGANFGPLTLGGQWWRLFTACFLHFGIVHIGFNMYVLYQVGMNTEIIYGRVKYLFIYLLAGVVGNLASVWFHPDSVGAGASGAIFGVYGAFLGFLLIKRAVIPKMVMAQMVRSAAIFLGINLAYGLYSAETDLSAHIGGLVCGFVLGCYFSYGSEGAAGQRRSSTI